MIGHRIAELREAIGYTQERLAQALGISRAALSHYEKDRREPDAELLNRMASFFEVTTDYLITGEKRLNFVSRSQVSTTNDTKRLYTIGTDAGAHKKRGNLPGGIQEIDTTWVRVLGNIRAGYDLYADEQVIDMHPVRVSDVSDGAEYFCLRVQGDSMTGDDIADGDTVLVRRQNFVEEGKIAVIIYNGDKGTLKRVSFHDHMAILDSSNPAYHAKAVLAEDVHIIGQVVKSYKELRH